MRERVIESIEKNKIIVIVRGVLKDDLIPLAEAMYEGGIRLIECTYDASGVISDVETGERIRMLKEHFADRMFIGAGTVINEKQCKDAIKAGATFIVSPGLSVGVAKVCKKKNIPYYPGCVTPTEIMQALDLGITTVKFFPANVYGGLSALKALSAPFPQVKFIPTGGVDRSNIDEFLAFDKIAAIGGSFFVKEALEKMEDK